MNRAISSETYRRDGTWSQFRVFTNRSVRDWYLERLPDDDQRVFRAVDVHPLGGGPMRFIIAEKKR